MCRPTRTQIHIHTAGQGNAQSRRIGRRVRDTALVPSRYVVDSTCIGAAAASSCAFHLADDDELFAAPVAAFRFWNATVVSNSAFVSSFD